MSSASRHLILFGAPGSGKGTQASRLVEEFGYNHVSTGDLLRKEMAKKSPLGLSITEIMNTGKLVDDQTVLELLKANLSLDQKSYIFDGYPRNAKQAQELDTLLSTGNFLAIYFDIDLNLIVNRIVNRRSCEKCGTIYNLLNDAPKTANKCDKCDGGLIQRKDDNEDVVRNRLNVFKETVDPLLAFYESKGKFKRIDASKDINSIWFDLKNIVMKV